MSSAAAERVFSMGVILPPREQKLILAGTGGRGAGAARNLDVT